MNNTKLATYFYAGLSILVLSGLFMWVWAKDYSSSKLFYNSPEIAIFLFAGCCFVSAFLFGYALKQGGKKSLFVPLLVVSLLIGLIGSALAYFIQGIGQL